MPPPGEGTPSGGNGSPVPSGGNALPVPALALPQGRTPSAPLALACAEPWATPGAATPRGQADAPAAGMQSALDALPRAPIGTEDRTLLVALESSQLAEAPREVSDRAARAPVPDVPEPAVSATRVTFSETAEVGSPGRTGPSIEVSRSVFELGWAQSVGQRLLVLARDGVQIAALRLQPPELGTVEVRIALNNAEATVHFAAPHPAAREMLEQALPRLRDSFEAGGLTLVDVDVSADGFERRASASSAEVADDISAGTPDASAEALESSQASDSDRLIDQYV